MKIYCMHMHVLFNVGFYTVSQKGDFALQYFNYTLDVYIDLEYT